MNLFVSFSCLNIVYSFLFVIRFVVKERVKYSIYIQLVSETFNSIVFCIKTDLVSLIQILSGVFKLDSPTIFYIALVYV